VAVQFGILTRPRRLSRWWIALGCFAAGGAIALLLAAAGGYGWFARESSPNQVSKLAPAEAERIARGFATQELRLVQDASRAESRLPGSPTANDSQHDAVNGPETRLAMIENKFLAPGGANGAGGAWLFVFRAGGIGVDEWHTSNAVLEVTVVLSDVSGRMLQTGTTLLPHADDAAAGVR
jgi:hypothetical protein